MTHLKQTLKRLQLNYVENRSEKNLTFHNVKVVFQARMKLIMGGMYVRTPFNNLKKCMEKGIKILTQLSILISIGMIHHFFTSCGYSPMKIARVCMLSRN